MLSVPSVFIISIFYMFIFVMLFYVFFFSSRRLHTRCALVTGVQTCALPILMEVFDAGFFARPQAAVGSHDGRPLFVVGMPRSGTTLTEQIIAMHSRAHGCGELPDLPLIVKTLGARWPDIARDLEPGLLEREAARYLQAASRHAAADVLRLVDKTPLNYFNLGLVALLFPQARVVWCRRDPRDIAISIYS